MIQLSSGQKAYLKIVWSRTTGFYKYLHIFFQRKLMSLEKLEIDLDWNDPKTGIGLCSTDTVLAVVVLDVQQRVLTLLQQTPACHTS